MAYLAKGDKVEAREFAFKMLDLNPGYSPDPLKDPLDFIKLLKSVDIIPRFSLGLNFSFGVNQTLLDIREVYMVANQDIVYRGGNSLQFGISSRFQLSKSLAIKGIAQVLPKIYEQNMRFDNWQIDVSETLTYLELPLMLSYTPFNKGRLKLDLDGGVLCG